MSSSSCLSAFRLYQIISIVYAYAQLSARHEGAACKDDEYFISKYLLQLYIAYEHVACTYEYMLQGFKFPKNYEHARTSYLLSDRAGIFLSDN